MECRPLGRRNICRRGTRLHGHAFNPGDRGAAVAHGMTRLRSGPRSGVPWTRSMRNALIGVGLAAGAALLAINPRIYGVDFWKIVLGVIGISLIREAGRVRKP